MNKVFKYRIYANQSTVQTADRWLETCRHLYNLCLEHRIYCYKNHRKSISWYQQSRELTEMRKEFPEFNIYRDVLDNVLKRLDRSYQGFFSRIKAGQKAGFPRFKGHDRYNSFTFRKYGYKIKGKYLIVTGIGQFKMKLSQPIKGVVQEMTLKRSAGNKWFVMFSCKDVLPNVLNANNNKIGIDVGCESFLTGSNGSKIANPRFFNTSHDKLAKAQKELARKKLRSNRRKKTKIRLSKIHTKIQDQRRDFHYKVANILIKNYGIICIEKLVSWNSFKSLNKSMRDVAWFQFFEILKRKAEEAGRRVIEVNPKNTSQMCSTCGSIVKKDLSCRVHSCSCGLTLDRDVNSAINILKLGQSLQAVSSRNSC